MVFESIREQLKKKVSNVKYFDRRTFNIILDDRKKAVEIAENGGDVQSFYRTSRTAETKFYQKNSGAYCELLSLLCEATI